MKKLQPLALTFFLLSGFTNAFATGSTEKKSDTGSLLYS